MALKPSVTTNDIPFKPSTLPIETQKALNELEHADEYPKYATVEEMMWVITTDDSSSSGSQS